MLHLDRLSALMSRFELTVSICEASSANLFVFGANDDIQTQRLVLCDSLGALQDDGFLLFSALVDWGGASNPLLAALPARIEIDITDRSKLLPLVELLMSEQEARRCGTASVVNRLGEILMVHLLRLQIETGSTRVGVLGGLADPRLSRAIVAIHERPEHKWRAETLAEEAGLSKSRFTELFRAAVGETPLAYLRRWRMTLARQDIERGDRVQRVAHRYCYGSTEAMSRSFQQAFGMSPSKARP